VLFPSAFPQFFKQIVANCESSPERAEFDDLITTMGYSLRSLSFERQKLVLEVRTLKKKKKKKGKKGSRATPFFSLSFSLSTDF
jgi:hypothetical protein